MTGNDAWRLLGVATAAYLLGSIPSGVIVGRLWKGVDVRQHGSTHTGGLNTMRVVGIPAGIVAGLGDVAKGIAGVLLAQKWGPLPWGMPIAGLGAVVGHNWSVYIKFGGGLGLATLIGCMILVCPAVIPLAALVFVVLYAVTRDRPRAAAGMVLSLGPLLWALGASTEVIALGIVAGGASFLKHWLEIRRGYRAQPWRRPKESN